MDVHRNCNHAAWLNAAKVPASADGAAGEKVWRFVLLGAPGVGKGTQAELLARKFGSCPLSTGDVFRTAISRPEGELSPAMREASVFMRSGRLVPDETVIHVVRERMDCLRCAGGFLLDGFPRTVGQAEALQEMLRNESLRLDAVLSYELPVDQVVDRISSRRVCPKCKRSYHLIHHPPRHEGVCDDCGIPLAQRDDDRPEAIRVRLATYEQQTAPVIGYYAAKDLLVRIPCGETPAETFSRTLRALGIAESQ